MCKTKERITGSWAKNKMNRDFIMGGFGLVAIVVGVGYYFYSHFTELKEGKVQLEQEIAGLEKEWVELRQQQGESAYNQQKVLEIEAQIKGVQGEIDARQKEVDQRRKETDMLERAYRKVFLKHRDKVWENAVGDKFDEVVTPQGKPYTNVIITRVRSHEISFVFGANRLSAEGHALPLHEMPLVWAKKYMFRPEEIKAGRADMK